MATWTRYYDFVPIKEEGTSEASGSFPLHPIRWHRVEIRDDHPGLTDLLSPWDFKKILTASDVGQVGGLVLGREHVHSKWDLDWNPVNRGQQVPIVIRDVETRSNYNLFLRKWTNDDNFIIHNNWLRDFVFRRDLKEEPYVLVNVLSESM
ncbi:hypothetical protein IFM89_034221 [Coptis chinensis]|uniref:Uncharacterized protein n=1 Tax=Coptis chinensis TaxID=261450 RepID=A0A835H873_9MAGN|nr:hypothetical protein IFM89_034221 [Coptis chinensis]